MDDIGPIVIGIDPSSMKLAVVYSTDATSKAEVKTYELRKKAGRFDTTVPHAAKHATLDLLEMLPPAKAGHRFRGLACIEEFAMGKGGVRSTAVQCYATGPVIAELTNAGFRVVLVPPGTWKKEVTGNGSASKAAIQDWLRTYVIHNDDGDATDVAGIAFAGKKADQDICDAAAIWVYARGLHGITKELFTGQEQRVDEDSRVSVP